MTFVMVSERSPMYTHAATCIDEIEVIRTCHMENEMITKFDSIQDG